jgi:hypothetical protein
MGGDKSQFTERLDWQGLVSWQAAVVIGVVLAAVAAWALWREREALGRGWAMAFWFLRLAAFGCALWMLAGPTWLHIERSSTDQTVAIFADNSDSMEVVDPVDAFDSVRWSVAVSGDTGNSPVARGDRLAVALGAAISRGEQLSRYVSEHRSPEQMRGLAKTIRAAVQRAASHAETIVSAIEGRNAPLAERASRIADLLEGPISGSLTAVQSALEGTEQNVTNDLTARLETLLANLATARRRAVVLASDLAEQGDTSESATRQDIDRFTRREKEGKALEAFERELADQLPDEVRIKRFQFVDAPVPVSTGEGWTNALSSAGAGSAPPSAASSLLDDTAPSRMTNLSAVLEQLARDRAANSTRLAVIWSDGRHNAPAAAAPQDVAANLAGVPLYIVPIGNSTPLRDIVVHRVEAPTAVAEKDTAIIDVIVTGFESDGDVSDVVLRREGGEIERRPIEFTGDRSDVRIRFSVPANEVGRHEYVVEVEPLETEANSANNYMPVAFDVVREQVRVLLADSAARWEFRYLSQLFRRDSHVVCDELLFFPRLTGTGRLQQRPEFPKDIAGWASYDVVILGDVDARQLPQASQEALDEYVRTRGGNVIVIAGRDGMPGKFVGQPMMDMIPVEFSGAVPPAQGFGLRLTDEGRISSALLIADSEIESRQAWQQIYSRNPLEWLSEYSRPKPTARTLINATSSLDEQPGQQPEREEPAFLCWQRVGAGRVVYLSAPSTYVLRFREGDRLHHRFWGQMLRWITAAGAGAGTDMVRLQTDRTRYTAGEPVEVTVWLKDKSGQPLAGQAIQVEARTFDDVSVTADLTADGEVAGRYFATLSELPAGAYNITVRGPVIDELVAADRDTEMAKSTISVRPSDNAEMMNTQCNRALLEQLAQMTGGQVIPPTAVGEVLQLVSFTPDVRELTQSTPLWNRWSNLILVLGCLFTEWVVRKAKGLV